MPDEEECFVVSPIGGEGSDTRERSDKVLEYVIEPAVEEYGYNPVRADHIAEPGIITTQVIEHVVESPLVIADLTGSNANVFYELAVRHAIQKPLIQLIDSEDKIPFDVASTRVIQFDVNDIESATDARDEIQGQIDSIESGTGEVNTPISIAADLRNLRESGDPGERSMADIMDTLTELRHNVIAIQDKLETPEEIVPPDYVRELSEETQKSQISDIESEFYKIEEIIRDIASHMFQEDKEYKEEKFADQIERLYEQIQTMKMRLYGHDPHSLSVEEFE